MKHIPFVFIVFSIIGWSCDSSLSDTEFEDPSIIRPWLEVRKTIDNGARVVEYICEIYDKNLALVTLKNGSVKIENVEMGKRTYLFGGEGYYISGESNVQHKLNKEYTFTLTLSDGKQYHGTVTSQTKDLYEFNVPASHNRNQNMIVTWKDTDVFAKMYISMFYRFRTDTSSGSGIKTLQINNPLSGTNTIDSSEFQTDKGTMYEAELTLVSEIEGTIDSNFRSGSKVVSQLGYTRKVTLN